MAPPTPGRCSRTCSDAPPLVAIVDTVDRELPDLRAAADLARLVQVNGVEDLDAHLPELGAVFAWSFDRPRSLDVVPRAPRLRWIQSISAGVEELASPTLPAHGVVLTNAAGVNDPGLAESALGFLLAFSARLLEDARLRPGEWPGIDGDEPALIEALARGVIAGAALDVFAMSRSPPSPLWRMPNVLVSPHRAGDHERWAEDVVAPYVENLRRFRAGEPLRSIVDVELGYAPGGRS